MADGTYIRMGNLEGRRGEEKAKELVPKKGVMLLCLAWIFGYGVLVDMRWF
jgi:hypothetical protein